MSFQDLGSLQKFLSALEKKAGLIIDVLSVYLSKVVVVVAGKDKGILNIERKSEPVRNVVGNVGLLYEVTVVVNDSDHVLVNNMNQSSSLHQATVVANSLKLTEILTEKIAEFKNSYFRYLFSAFEVDPSTLDIVVKVRIATAEEMEQYVCRTAVKTFAEYLQNSNSRLYKQVLIISCSKPPARKITVVVRSEVTKHALLQQLEVDFPNFSGQFEGVPVEVRPATPEELQKYFSVISTSLNITVETFAEKYLAMEEGVIKLEGYNWERRDLAEDFVLESKAVVVVDSEAAKERLLEKFQEELPEQDGKKIFNDKVTVIVEVRVATTEELEEHYAIQTRLKNNLVQY